jgi:hypothetical protein
MLVLRSCPSSSPSPPSSASSCTFKVRRSRSSARTCRLPLRVASFSSASAVASYYCGKDTGARPVMLAINNAAPDRLLAARVRGPPSGSATPSPSPSPPRSPTSSSPSCMLPSQLPCCQARHRSQSTRTSCTLPRHPVQPTASSLSAILHLAPPLVSALHELELFRAPSIELRNQVSVSSDKTSSLYIFK